MFFKKRHIISLAFILSMLFTTSFSATACDSGFPPFDPASDYITIEPISVQLVYIDETDRYGLNHFNGQFGQLWQTPETFHESRDWLLSHRGFDVDSRQGNLPSQREHLTSYDDAFFTQYNLLWLAYEGFYQGDALIPTDPPELNKIYLQNGVIHISDSTDLPVNRRDDMPGFEYHIYVCIDKDAIHDIPTEDINCVSYTRYNSINAPQTSDPTTALTVTAAVSLTALCLLPAVGKKRRQR